MWSNWYSISVRHFIRQLLQALNRNVCFLRLLTYLEIRRHAQVHIRFGGFGPEQFSVCFVLRGAAHWRNACQNTRGSFVFSRRDSLLSKMKCLSLSWSHFSFHIFPWNVHSSSLPKMFIQHLTKERSFYISAWNVHSTSLHGMFIL